MEPVIVVAAAPVELARILAEVGRVTQARDLEAALDATRGPERPALVVTGDPAVCTAVRPCHCKVLFAAEDVERGDADADGYQRLPACRSEVVASARTLIRLHALEADHARQVVADHRKDELLGWLGHELRNPLQALHMAMPLLERFPARDPIEARARDIVNRQTTSLTQLVDSVVDLARLVRGRLELERDHLELGAFTANVCEAMRGELRGRDQVLLVEPTRAPIWIHADATRLAQALRTLIDHCAGRRSGVEVAALAVDDGAELVVRDRATKPAAPPRGLALALVEALVELQGGRLTSRAADGRVGNQLRIWLPLSGSASRSG